MTNWSDCGREKILQSRITFAALLLLLVSSCTSWEDPATERAQRAEQNTGDIVIGAVWPWNGGKGQLWQGIELAVEEINTNGGLLKRKLRIVKEDDESSLAKGRLIAQQFAETPDMVAVIGHLNSYIALPASHIYQSAGLLYLTPGASSYQLNEQGYPLVFRNIPSTRSIALQMADYLAGRGLRRIAVYYVKDKSSQNMVNFFEQHAQELDMTVVDRRSFAHGSRDFANTIQNWKDLYRFDAIFLAANMPEGAHFIAQARKMGLTVPIICGDGLDTPALVDAAGSAAEGVVVPNNFARDDDLPAYHRFNDHYTRKYGTPPHTYAALGYDAIHLIAQAIRQANSSAPEKAAAALRATRQWQGASGEFSFDEKGDIPDKKIGVKVVRGGQFVIEK
jgi:branched-chain amino acid transport system substrate-binding protein